MSYTATVIPVMIASPSDVHALRVLTRDILLEWNYVHSDATNLVLMPVGWETHSSPELGGTAQDLINERVLKDCDLLIGVFWTRMGTPTAHAASGTAEEIERHVSAGKPAMLFFSSAPVAPESLDPAQFAALQSFKTWAQSQGLIEGFAHPDEFKDKLKRQLQIALARNPHLKKIKEEANSVPGVGTPGVIGTPANPKAVIANTLPLEAQLLLKEAASDKSGTIFLITGRGGKFYQVNGKTLGGNEDRRQAAKWEDGLERLVEKDLVVRRGLKSQVYEVTTLGYEIADFMQNSSSA
ncbi:MAG: hypothetical protein OMOMHJEC_03349 [Xanthomonadales bacterium]|nr:hypothetical protein [Xanthomonadales bacterium]